MNDISLANDLDHVIQMTDKLKCKECGRDCVQECCKECKYQKNEVPRQIVYSLSGFLGGSLLALVITLNPLLIISGGMVISNISCNIMNLCY